MKLLMLAFEFPPRDGVGTHRSLKFAKYLPEHGVHPVVVTLDKESFEVALGPAREAAMLDELPVSTSIERVPCPPVLGREGPWFSARMRRFFTLDDGFGRAWRGPLLAVWKELVKREQPEAIFVTVPPFSMAPLAVELARLSGLPLIMDFRDAWSQWWAPQQSLLHYHLTLRRERACINAATAVIGVTRQLVDDLKHVHSGVPVEKFHVITNGYDASMPEILPPRSESRADQPFVIGYVGGFYYTPRTRASVMNPWWKRSPIRWLQYSPRREDWLYRSPFFFFRALRRLLDDRPDLRSRVRVRFAGGLLPWLEAQVAEFGLTDVVEHLGRMSHRACLEFQASCDALLATSAKVIGGRDYCIAGKTFEYVTSQVPIIAFVTEGEQQDFFKASGYAIVCDPDDPEVGSKRLEELIEGRLKFTPDLSFLAKYHRRETAGQLAGLLRCCAGKS